jgi:hypothetical protein
MSLRKSAQVSPELAAANRGNAQNSTGPRTPAGKEHSRLNALKHGLYTAAQNEPAVMSALGEDPAEFEAERQALLESYGPGDELWYHQIDDLARLYWRRSRLDRAIDRKVRILMQMRRDYRHERSQGARAPARGVGAPAPGPAAGSRRAERNEWLEPESDTPQTAGEEVANTKTDGTKPECL